MARLSSICGAARRLENLVSDAVVDYWLQKSQWQKASRDFAHSRRRTRMVWENRVASLTADEFKRQQWDKNGADSRDNIIKGLRKALFMTLSSNSFEGSRPTYLPQSPTFASANVAQLVAREAENPKVLCLARGVGSSQGLTKRWVSCRQEWGGLWG